MSSPTPSPTRARSWRSPSPDLILGVVLIAVALGFLAYTLGLSADAAGWPRAVLALLLVLGAAIAVRALRAPAAGPAATGAADAGTAESGEAAGTAEDGEWSPRVLRRPALALAIIVGYVALLEVIGFLPTTALYLLGHLWLNGVRDWRVLVGVAVGVVAFIYLLFVYQLSVPLPAGLLFE